jgi:FMN reductase
MTVVAVVGNPRPASRTHAIARTLAAAIAEVRDDDVAEVDLAILGPRVLDKDDPAARHATEQTLDADFLVVASPTYKATYSGLLKAFLDRIGGGALEGAPAVPVLLGGAPDHRLAVDVHLTPLLLELGATVPARGLFVLESELDGFPDRAARWARDHLAQPTGSRP